jgi:hypothetical protein
MVLVTTEVQIAKFPPIIVGYLADNRGGRTNGPHVVEMNLRLN